MKNLFSFLIALFITQSIVALPGTLVSIDPDSAFQGQTITVTVTFPAGTLLTYASPGDQLIFSAPGKPSFYTLYMQNFNPAGDQETGAVHVDLTQPPGIYDVRGFAGHWDPFSMMFVADDTFDLQQAFVVLETNVYGRLFVDNNSNGVYEYALGDRLWANKRIDVSPDSISVYTDRNGFFLMTLPNGSHTIQYTTGPGETITTGNSPAIVNVTPGSVHDMGYIGVQTPPVYSLVGGAWLGRRCNRLNDGYLYVSNYSNRSVDVTATLVLSPNIDFRSAVPPPDSVSGDTLVWNFQGIPPGGYVNVAIRDSIPSAGDTLIYSITTTAYVGGLPVDTFVQNYHYFVTCSYDPNDKSVNPAGTSPFYYTLKGEDLFYHINFQNTGNDTAFDVVVRDTLDADLDLNTFTFLGSSSPAIVKLDYNTRVAEFKMNNILLPDSTTNESGSHGYVDYKISHIAGIPDGTEISNTAYIYFDFNPPIATNATINTLVTTLPSGWVELSPGKGVLVMPNPFTNTARLIVKNRNGETCLLQIWNELGELIITSVMQSDTYLLSKGNLSPGLYFYRLDSKSGTVNGRFLLIDK